MAKDKKPSIYDDRGTIGSSDELDEYGVWIKSEPQDLSFAGAESQDMEDEDFGVPDMEDMPDFDTLQSNYSSGASGDANEDDDFSLPEFDDSQPKEEKSGDESFNLEGFQDHEDSSEASSAEGSSAEASSAEPSSVEAVQDAGEDLNLPEPESFAEASPAEIKTDDDDDKFTEIPLDDFAATLDAEEEEPVVTKPDAPAAAKHEQMGTPDLSTELLMKIAEELSSIRAELSSLKKEFSSAGTKPEPAPAPAGERGFFDGEEDEKIALTGAELINIMNTADFTEEAGIDATSELSDDHGIEEAEDTKDDTSSGSSEPFHEQEPVEIDTAAIDLEKQKPLELVSEEKAAAEAVQTEPLPDFSIEDNDLDLLSGLDKDLNLDEAEPADKPEETAGLDLPPDTVVEDSVAETPVDLDISPEEETAPLNSGTNQSDAIPEIPEFDVEETDELKKLMENGAEPMAFAPEPADTDYLASDPLAENDSDSKELPMDIPADISAEEPGESLDLSQAVIDEPDLSSDIQENPPEEPSPEDVSISLDLGDLGPAAGAPDAPEVPVETAGEPEEIELPLPEAEDSSPGGDLSLIPEGFVVEADGAPHEEIETISDEELDILDDDIPEISGESQAPETVPPEAKSDETIPSNIKEELKTVLSYMDQLLESLPDDKIEEFAKSEYYDTYKKLFKELGLV